MDVTKTEVKGGVTFVTKAVAPKRYFSRKEDEKKKMKKK